MYEELVKIMRQQHRDMTCGNCKTCVTPQAADAIESLCIENDRLYKENDRLYKAVTDLARTVIDLARESKWIPVTDHTPKYKGVVTHWMPRPELPKEET